MAFDFACHPKIFSGFCLDATVKNFCGHDRKAYLNWSLCNFKLIWTMNLNTNEKMIHQALIDGWGTEEPKSTRRSKVNKGHRWRSIKCPLGRRMTPRMTGFFMFVSVCTCVCTVCVKWIWRLGYILKGVGLIYLITLDLFYNSYKQLLLTLYFLYIHADRSSIMLYSPYSPFSLLSESVANHWHKWLMFQSERSSTVTLSTYSLPGR